MRPRRSFWLLALGVLLASGAVLLHWGELRIERGQETATAEGARTAAERRVRQTQRVAAPRSPPRQDAVESPPLPNVADARPPSGYGFVTHHGEMTKARVENVATAIADVLAPEWLVLAGVASLVDQAVSLGRPWLLGWVYPAPGATHADLSRALAGTGATIVGRSGQLFRARLPADSRRLALIESLAAVRGIGAMPPEVKLAAFGGGALAMQSERTGVYVTLMDDDRAGRWRRAMADLGVAVEAHDPALRAYRATADGPAILALAATDYVVAVEPVPVVEATHDTAVPAMGVDALWRYSSSLERYQGVRGSSVPVAVMDTGLNINHADIAANRASICGANFVFSHRGVEETIEEDDDLWVDQHGHGTHVTGTVAGSGSSERQFAGMAPAVRHIRFAKVLNRGGSSSGDSVRRGMEYLAKATECHTNGGTSARVKPQIVNMSLSWTNLDHEGRDFGARKLDSTVWTHRQLYVVAQSNRSRSGFSNYGAAKNGLAVGATTDGGELASFSSHGPTADGRLAPNVVAVGVRVHSARGGGARGGHRAISGTSMASPAVAGVAALLLDAVPEHRNRPALTRARLMASAIRPDAWLEEGGGFAPDNSAGPGPQQVRYGMGKVSARTAVLQRDRPDGWQSGSATTELTGGEYAYHDIDVPPGASRLDLVMTWDEPPADAVASTVVNDLDLWLDEGADCASHACGEHVSRSRIDNVEWLVVRDPAPGTYRVKVVANRIYTVAPRAAVAWTLIRGASTPTVEVTANTDALTGAGLHELTLALSADGYAAAGTLLHIDCRSDSATCDDAVTVEGVWTTRARSRISLADEVTAPVPDDYRLYTRADRPFELGSSLPVGELAAGETRTIHLLVRVAEKSDGARLHFAASAWNGRAGETTVDVGDGADDQAVRPANDAFSAATPLQGASGSTALDLLLATPEPGEPTVRYSTRSRGRPSGSVWYTWTAPTGGPFRFKVPGIERFPEDRAPDERRLDRVDVYQGDAIASLNEVASGLWGASFFAQEGARYRIRVSSASRGAAVELTWSPEGRPGNDDFVDAMWLEGETGTAQGSGAGATLEAGESFGEVAATTWFHWIAPEDGLWEFRGGSHVLVFEGDHVSQLRLIGPRPSSRVQFFAAAGRKYHIAVAEGGGEESGLDYTLRWQRIDKELRGNDWFANAEEIQEDEWSGTEVSVGSAATVEPDEPPESGVRTQWYSWDAPVDGSFTLRLEAAGGRSGQYPMLKFSVFAGTDLEDLEQVASVRPGAAHDAVVAATAGERYWISVGFAADDLAAFDVGWASAALVLGPTPENDRVEASGVLAGTSGSVVGSNEFATTGRDEGNRIGRAALWWTHEADRSGWMRFAVEGKAGPWELTVHREATDGSGLEIAASSRWQRSGDEPTEVLIEVEKGVRYSIALGTRGAGRGEFTLRWEEAVAPAWLRYIGRLADGDRGSQGEPVLIRGPGAMARNKDDGTLYLGSRLGLQVFEQLGAGALGQVQLIESKLDLARARLVWDQGRGRLLADDCGSWREFAPIAPGWRLRDLGELEVEDGPSTCAEQLLMDEAGLNLYRVGRSDGLETYTVGPEGTLSFVESQELNRGIPASIMSNDGRRVYVTTGQYLWVFDRDLESGALTRADATHDFSSYRSSRRSSMAISDDDALLFVHTYDGTTHALSLDDSAVEHVAELAKFWDWPWEADYCRFGDVRGDGVTVDFLCPGLAITVRLDPQTGELVETDSVTARGDRFNGPTMPNYGIPTGMVPTLDDTQVHVGTPAHGILTISRVGGVD